MYSFLRSFLEEDQANLIVCMISIIPLSYLLSLIRQKFLFLALSMSLTLAFQSFLFPTESYFLWAQQQIVYLLIMFVPRKIVGHVVFGESFLALSFIQIRRMYLTYAVNGVDITGIFMMQLFVWVSMAYNYQNAIKPSECLTQDAKTRMIVQRPEYMTYLGYVNFLPACLIGPVYEYRDYEDYLHRKGDYKQIPNQLKATGKEALVFLTVLILYVGSMSLDTSHILGHEFGSYPLIIKFLYITFLIIHLEFKYITAWSLGMISMKASGFTYNPKNNKVHEDGTISHNFDRVRVSDFTKIYLQPSIKVKAEGWNMSVQIALKKYIYQQIYDPTKTYKSQGERKRIMSKAQLITFLTSAVWHGFYFGYFISFFHYFLCLQVNTEVYKWRVKSQKMKELWSKYKILTLLDNMIWTFCLCFFGVPINLMIWEKIKIHLYSIYGLPYLILYVAFILVIPMKVLFPKIKQL